MQADSTNDNVAELTEEKLLRDTLLAFGMRAFIVEVWCNHDKFPIYKSPDGYIVTVLCKECAWKVVNSATRQ